MAISPASSSHADALSLHTLDLNPAQDAPQQHSRPSTPPVASSPHDQISTHRSSRELALRSQLATPEQSPASETGSVVLAATAAAAARQTQLENLRGFAQEQAAPFKNGENDHALDALAEQRAQRMLDRGENANDLRTLFSFADAVDASAHDAAGASGSIGFLLANVFGSHVTPLLVDGAAQQGAVSGVVTYALLHTVGNINEKMTAHTGWGTPGNDLDPDVAAVVERNAAATTQKFKELGINYQAFPATFLATGLLNSALTFASLKTAMMAKNVIGPLSSLVGGGVVAQLGRNADLRHHRVGSAMILMSDNWEDHLDTLKNTTYLQSMRNGSKQLSTDTRRKFVAGLQQAAEQAPRPSTLAKAAIWTGGMALNSWASAQVTQLMKSHGFSDAEIFTAQSAMFAIALVPTTAAWTSLIALGPQLDQKAKQALDAVMSWVPQRAPASQPAAAQPALPSA